MLKISRTHKVFCRILSSRVGAKETTTRNCWFAWEGKKCEMWLSVNRILDAITLFPTCFLNFHMFHHRSYIIHSSCCAYTHVPPVACRSDMEHQQYHDEHQQWNINKQQQAGSEREFCSKYVYVHHWIWRIAQFEPIFDSSSSLMTQLTNTGGENQKNNMTETTHRKYTTELRTLNSTPFWQF